MAKIKIVRRVRAGLPFVSTAFAVALLASGIAWTQTPAGNGTAKSQMMAKNADPD